MFTSTVPPQTPYADIASNPSASALALDIVRLSSTYTKYGFFNPKKNNNAYGHRNSIILLICTSTDNFLSKIVKHFSAAFPSTATSLSFLIIKLK